MMVPEFPTPPNNTLEVVVELSVVVVVDLLLLQEMMVKLKRKRERMMSICLTWFPISGLGEPNIYHDSRVFHKEVGRLWEMCIRFLIHHPLFFYS